MKTISKTFFLTLIATLPLSAAADSNDAELEALVKAVASLQKRVEILEAMKPTITSLMPNFSERFHVMHRAGEAGDWAVAGHELQEMKRLAALSAYIETDTGELMAGMMEPNFEALEHAIEHGNPDKFQNALENTVTSCNACHTATGSPFIQVTLDAADAISLRHPHALASSAMVGGHTHGSPAMNQNMEQHKESMAGGAPEQDHHEDEPAGHGHEEGSGHQD